MWLPAPLYESLPYNYVLGGVLFLSGTLYIGVTAPGASLYIACGLISTIFGVVVFVRRHASRAAAVLAETAEPARTERH